MDLSIAVIGHGHREFLERLLSSIFRAEIKRQFEVVFVENIDVDGSAAFVEECYPMVRIVRNLHPHGFAENNNLAFSLAAGRYFVMLNPDTELQRGAMDAMARFLDSTPTAGACGPKLLFADGSLQLSCRRFPTVRSFLLRRTPLRWLQPDLIRDRKHLMADWEHDEEQQVDWLLGACIMVRRQAYEMVRGMNERLEMYCEDIDLCSRLHAAGWGVHYVPEAVVVHHHLAETDRRFLSAKTLMHYRSMLRYVREHGIRFG